MSPWFGFEDPDGVDPKLEQETNASVNGDIESQVFAGYHAVLDTPHEVEDLDYFGPEYNTYHRCYHGHIPERKVAFDMAATGHRFIACPGRAYADAGLLYGLTNHGIPCLPGL